MNAPLAIAALVLWVVLICLTIRQCRRWAKVRNKPVVKQQNHPAIPEKAYSLSDFEDATKPVRKAKTALSPKLSTGEPAQRLSPRLNAWDT